MNAIYLYKKEPNATHCIPIPSSLTVLQASSRPKTPGPRNDQLKPAYNPKRTLHPPRADRKKPTSNSTNHHRHKRPKSLIPLWILAPLHQETRIGRNVVQHTRQHDRRYGVMTQGARRDDLARGLETQQRDGQALTPVDFLVQAVEAAFDKLPLDEPGRKEHDPSLHDESKD